MKQLIVLLWVLVFAAYGYEPGAFAASRYTTDLTDVCPNPLIIQKDWLMQAEHGGLVQLIGAAGTASQGRYSGPLGSTGIELIILEGGRGLGLGDGESPLASLHIGNSRAGVIPHLAMVTTDDAIVFSELFPSVAVVAPLARNPQVLIYDPETYPEGFQSREDLIAFAESGVGKIYLTTTSSGFGRFLASFLPPEVFVEGYGGDLENFVAFGGSWLNQGFVTSEVWELEHGRNWGRPVGYLFISDLGYDVYPGPLAVAAGRLEELAPCLERLVPLVQQAQLDYANDPTEVNDVIVAFNEAGYGAGFWRTPRGQVAEAHGIMRQSGVIGNGHNATLGDFDLMRVEEIIEIFKPFLDERARADLTAADLVTNRFIDPAIGVPLE
jgi:hypothetical protein